MGYFQTLWISEANPAKEPVLVEELQVVPLLKLEEQMPLCSEKEYISAEQLTFG